MITQSTSAKLINKNLAYTGNYSSAHLHTSHLATFWLRYAWWCMHCCKQASYPISLRWIAPGVLKHWLPYCQFRQRCNATHLKSVLARCPDPVMPYISSWQQLLPDVLISDICYPAATDSLTPLTVIRCFLVTYLLQRRQVQLPCRPQTCAIPRSSRFPLRFCYTGHDDGFTLSCAVTFL